jgi:uncharacterized protein YcbK (DUF882 family)
VGNPPKINKIMKQNKYFKESEFVCKHCHSLPEKGIPDSLIDFLCEIREHYNSPVIINSGYRCKEHNAKIGGAPKSRHVEGDAVDFVVKGVKTLDLFNYIIKAYDDRPWGIAKRISKDPYAGFVHVDHRGTKARWTYKGSIVP